MNEGQQSKAPEIKMPLPPEKETDRALQVARKKYDRLLRGSDEWNDLRDSVILSHFVFGMPRWSIARLMGLKLEQVSQMLREGRADRQVLLATVGKKAQQMALIHLLRAVTIQADTIFQAATAEDQSMPESEGESEPRGRRRTKAGFYRSATDALRTKTEAILTMARILGIDKGNVPDKLKPDAEGMTDEELEKIASEEKQEENKSC